MKSTEYAQLRDQKHGDIMKNIRSILKKEPHMITEFTLTSRIVNGRDYPMYLVSSVGRKELDKLSRLRKETKEMLEKLNESKFKFNPKIVKIKKKKLNVVKRNDYYELTIVNPLNHNERAYIKSDSGLGAEKMALDQLKKWGE